MKLVLAIDSLMGGGKERQFVELAKGLAGRSDPETTCLVFHPEIHYNEVEEIDIPFHIIHRRKKYDAGVYLEIFRFLRQVKPDIVHSWNPMVSMYLLPFKRIFGFRFIEGSIRSAPAAGMIPRTDYRRIRWSSDHADIIVANSQAGLSSYGIRRNGMVIYNGFDITRTEVYDHCEKVGEGHDGSVHIGMVGNFTDNKDYETYFRAAELIRRKWPDTRFSAIGDGPCFQHFLDRYGSLPGYNLPGKQKNVENLIRDFDICVLCSTEYGEGISNAILEYLAMKKPVIALDCPGNREVIEPGISGLFYLLRDAGSLAWNLELLCGDRSLRRQLGQNGYDTLITKFSMDRMVGSYLALYKQLSN